MEIDKKEVNLALKVAIRAAEGHRGGCAAETCGGTSYDPCALSYALEALERYQREKGYLADIHTHPPCRGEGCEECNFVGQWREPARGCIAEHAPGEQTCEWCDPDAVPRRPTEEEYGSLPVLDRTPPAAPEWLPATFALCLAGDRIRLSGQETTVRDTRMAEWHARNREWTDDAGKTRDHQTRWDHTELLMDLEANPGMHEYPAATECEILCDAERRAALELQRAFPGTKPVDK